MHIIVADGLKAYGYDDLAAAVSRDFLGLIVDQYRLTGRLWEKYNVVSGGIEIPVERYPTPPHHGWTSAAVAVLGEYAFAEAPTHDR